MTSTTTMYRNRLGGYLNTLSGAKEEGRSELYLIEETLLSFGIASPELLVSPTSPPASALKPISVGTPISATALLPAVGVAGLKTNSSDITLEVPPKLKWKIQTVDFPKNATDPFSQLTSDPAAPSTTSADLAGSYQIVSGDLSSQQLTIIPWPEQGNDLDENVPSDKLRGFKISLEITMLLKNVGSTTFTFNKALYGIVNSWSTVISSANLTVPMTPREITATKPDPLAPFRALFKVQIDNKHPEVGEFATLIIRSQFSEQRHQSASWPNFTSSSGSADQPFKLGGSNGIVSVDLDGITFHENGPTTVGNPSPLFGTRHVGHTTPVAGAPFSTLGHNVVHIGSLTVVASAEPEDVVISATGSAASIHKLPEQLGAKILPVPLLLPEGIASGSAINIQATTLIKLGVPGRKSPLQVRIKLPDTLLYPPIINVPQVAFFFRDLENFERAQEEILVSMDPATRVDRPNISYLETTIDFLNERLQQFLQVYPKKEYIGSTKNVEINTLLNLQTVCTRILEFLNTPQARLLNASQDFSTAVGGSETIDFTNKFTAYLRTINSFLWIGPPAAARYQLKLASEPAGVPAEAGNLYVPYVATPALVYDKTRAETARPPQIGFAPTSASGEGQITNLDKTRQRLAVKAITWQFKP